MDPTISPIPRFQHYIVHQAEGTGRYYLVRGREFGDIHQLVEYYKVRAHAYEFFCIFKLYLYFLVCRNLLNNSFFVFQKNPLFVGGTESSDRSNFTGEPPFLSGTMVRRDLMEHTSEDKNGDIYGNDTETSDSGE